MVTDDNVQRWPPSATLCDAACSQCEIITAWRHKGLTVMARPKMGREKSVEGEARVR